MTALSESNRLKIWGRRLATVAAIAVAFFLGTRFAPDQHAPTQPHDHSGGHASAPWWTCSMHPQIRQPKKGKCPICRMDLIPATGQGTGGLREFSISAEAAALMEIETAPVERRYLDAQVRVVGKVEYDETRMGYITAWIPGRIDRLFVDYTGVGVKKGDHMVELYSPDLLVAENELIEAAKSYQSLQTNTSAAVRDGSKRLLDAAREKLRLWGLTESQIAEIESRRKGEDHTTIHAPMGGIVIHKNAQEGMYVQTGSRIYTIADLSHVWVKFDAYESDLEWIRYGQDVSFTTEAYPGHTFQGRIAFIDPTMDDRRRTVKVRVNLPNADGRLKPGMFVRGVVKSQVAMGGRIMDPDLAGKWISPMHPEIVKDGPGSCDLCGMPLVRMEEMGYAPLTTTQDDIKPLVVPQAAVLLTGERAVVYVRVPGSKTPKFEGREIVIGPRAGKFYIVHEGLKEGELVVTNGNFKIDSALQIVAKPSMMNPGDAVAVSHQHAAVERLAVPDGTRDQLAAFVASYFSLSDALAKDDAKATLAAVSQAKTRYGSVEFPDGDHVATKAWQLLAKPLGQAVNQLSKTKDIKSAREAFAGFSEQMVAVIQAFDVHGTDNVFRASCPMAFNNRGAMWLQMGKDIFNPYFGKAMLKCGAIQGSVASHDHAHH